MLNTQIPCKMYGLCTLLKESRWNYRADKLFFTLRKQLGEGLEDNSKIFEVSQQGRHSIVGNIYWSENPQFYCLRVLLYFHTIFLQFGLLDLWIAYLDSNYLIENLLHVLSKMRFFCTRPRLIQVLCQMYRRPSSCSTSSTVLTSEQFILSSSEIAAAQSSDTHGGRMLNMCIFMTAFCLTYVRKINKQFLKNTSQYDKRALDL